MKIWLSPEILEWDIDIFGQYSSGGVDFYKPYRILEHAKKKLAGANEGEDPNEENLDLGDIVKSLREVVEHRENKLKEKFNFKNLPFVKLGPKKNIPTYKFLLVLGITQPIMQEKLVKLRNIIVHEQRYPSNKDRNAILELWEFVWYFIRATDSFLGRDITSMIFYPEKRMLSRPFDLESFEEGCIYIFISEKSNWQINMFGRELPSNLFSQDQNQEWIEVEIEDFRDHEEVVFTEYDFENPKEISDEEKREEELARLSRLKESIDKTLSSGQTVKSFQGDIVGPPDKLKNIIEQHFSLYMFY
jgi:hypothetical protein